MTVSFSGCGDASVEAGKDAFRTTVVLCRDFPRDVLMPCPRGQKKPMFSHLHHSWKWDNFIQFALRVAHRRAQHQQQQKKINRGGGGGRSEADGSTTNKRHAEEEVMQYDLCVVLSDLCVVDIDDPALVRDFEARFQGALKKVPCVETTKGRHYWFSRSELADEYGFFDGRAQRVPGIDFKTLSMSGSGGIVCIPPSQGKRWIVPFAPSSMSSLCENTRLFCDLLEKGSPLKPIPDEVLKYVALPRFAVSTRRATLTLTFQDDERVEKEGGEQGGSGGDGDLDPHPSSSSSTSATFLACRHLQSMSYFEPFFSEDFQLEDSRDDKKGKGEGEEARSREEEGKEDAAATGPSFFPSFPLFNVRVPCDRATFEELLHVLREGKLSGRLAPTEDLLSRLQHLTRFMGVLRQEQIVDKLQRGLPHAQACCFKVFPEWWWALQVERRERMEDLVDINEMTSSSAGDAGTLRYAPVHPPFSKAEAGMKGEGDSPELRLSRDEEAKEKTEERRSNHPRFPLYPPPYTSGVDDLLFPGVCFNVPPHERPHGYSPGDAVLPSSREELQKLIDIRLPGDVKDTLRSFPGRVILAGGAALHAVTKKHHEALDDASDVYGSPFPINDYDLYLVGGNQNSAVKEACSFAEAEEVIEHLQMQTITKDDPSRLRRAEVLEWHDGMPGHRRRFLDAEHKHMFIRTGSSMTFITPRSKKLEDNICLLNGERSSNIDNSCNSNKFTFNSVDMNCNSNNVVIRQLVLKRYPSAAHVLSSFDISACKVAVWWDASARLWKVMASPTWPCCMRRLAFPLDLERWSTSSIFRVLKYFCKGFEVYITGADVDSVSRIHALHQDGILSRTSVGALLSAELAVLDRMRILYHRGHGWRIRAGASSSNIMGYLNPMRLGGCFGITNRTEESSKDPNANSGNVAAAADDVNVMKHLPFVEAGMGEWPDMRLHVAPVVSAYTRSDYEAESQMHSKFIQRLKGLLRSVTARWLSNSVFHVSVPKEEEKILKMFYDRGQTDPTISSLEPVWPTYDPSMPLFFPSRPCWEGISKPNHNLNN